MGANVEELTGLQNHAALKATLKQQVEAEQTVALAVLDIDKFMAVNEQHGHDVGDALLRHLAEMLKQAFPGQAYRVSGDEFAVLLPGASLESAFLRLEAFRSRVESAAGQLPVAATVTAGVAQYPRDARTVQSLLQAADAALVAAKEGGRNQVALPPTEEMVMKSCYYPAASIRRLKSAAERVGRKESELLREALADLLRKYDRP
ncbi:MAG TPA: diguanylate cyclase [Symbiobacteriaceae bacterium]|jgi:diguanylate cyclase|nr:diguanylate cyclase [Symbiobacteriaceae bacterium]